VRLEGKVAIVTGGGTGIGAATARRFAAEGAHVVVTGRRPEPIGAIAEEIGGVAVAGDAADADHARAAVETATRSFGGLDVVVANAGIGRETGALDYQAEVVEATIRVNLIGVSNSIGAVLPGMIERKRGHLVAISSIAGAPANCSRQ
jgi:NADP-dependent 3-hydroxy acid dehydrogenase YdfG